MFRLPKISEPLNYEDAMTSNNAEDWSRAMDDELTSVHKNDT